MTIDTALSTNGLGDIRSDVRLLKWMTGTNLGLCLIILGKLLSFF